MDEPTQPAEPTAEAKRSGGFAGYFVWGFVIVVLYVLSAGPFQLMDSKGMFGPSTQRFLYTGFYAPVMSAYLHTPLRKPLGVYFHLWCPAVFDQNGNNPSGR